MLDYTTARPRRLHGTLKAIAVVLPLAMSPPFSQDARADGCEEVLAALLKNPEAPMHTVMTVAVNGAALTLESYSVGGKIYSKRKGTWVVEASAFDPDKLKKAWDGSTCTQDGSEPVGAEIADMFSEHKHDLFLQSDSRFWVSRSTGYMLKSEISFNGTSTLSTTYEYGVQIPPEALAAQPGAATPPK